MLDFHDVQTVPVCMLKIPNTDSHTNVWTHENTTHTDRNGYKRVSAALADAHSSGAVWESRWPSWAVRPNEPSGFRGRKAILKHASALVSACP